MLIEEEDAGFLWGVGYFLAGAVAGVAGALLLAPRSGWQTREKVGGWFQERGARGRDLASRLREKIPHRVKQTAYPGASGDRRI